MFKEIGMGLLGVLIIITLFYSFSSSLKNFYLDLKTNYTSDGKYLAVITKNGLWIKEYFDDTHRVISANKPQGLNLLDVTIFHLNKQFVH